MVPLTVPDSGLTLLGSPMLTAGDKKENNPLQVMQLDLADGILEDLIKSARHGGKGLNVSFGKTIVRDSLSTPIDVVSYLTPPHKTLHYGNKSQQLTATPASSFSQLYDCPTESQTDLTFAGRLSHRLAIQKAKEETAGADEALAKLQSQLASHEKAKQSMQ